MGDRESLAGLASELALALRAEVLPLLGRHEGRGHVASATGGRGEGGDVTFEIDERAESFMEEFLSEHAPEVAFYSEDRGLVTPVVMPSGCSSSIRSTAPARRWPGSRPRACRSPSPRSTPSRGWSTCRPDASPRSSRERCSGPSEAGARSSPALSANRELDRMFWSYGLRGRPARAMAEVLGDLIDVSSVGGATFDLGSATFDMTRVASGQLRTSSRGRGWSPTFPDARGVRAGGAARSSTTRRTTSPRPRCAWRKRRRAHRCLWAPDRRRPLLGSGPEFQISCVAAANQDLHRAICESIDAGIARLADGAA